MLSRSSKVSAAPSASAAAMIRKGACQPQRACASSIRPPPAIAPRHSAIERMPPAEARPATGSTRIASALTGTSAQVPARAAAAASANSVTPSFSRSRQPSASSTAA